MTIQEVFDAVVKRLYDGTGPAIDQEGFCWYLDPETGRKCAVGIFIPDGHPAQHAENLCVDDLIYRFSDLPEFFYIRGIRDMLIMLQDAHDLVDHWDGNNFIAEDRLTMIANTFGVRFNKPTN